MKPSVLPRRCRPDPGPVADAVHRHGDAVPVGAAHAPEFRIEAVGRPLPQHVVVEGVRIVGARPAHQVMRHVGRDPGVQEAHGEDAAVKGLVAVEIGAPFPRDDGLQRRRLQVGHAPLAIGMVRNAERADVAGAPWQLRDPLDRVVEIHGLLIRARIRLSGRFSRAARIHPHAGIAARAPPHGIGGFPREMRIGFLLQVVGRDPQPVLLVRADVHDGGKALGAAVRAGTRRRRGSRRRASGSSRPFR